MQHRAMFVGQRMTLGIDPENDQDEDAPVENIQWATSASDLASVTADLDPATAVVRSLAPGAVRVSVRADSLIGAGENLLLDEWEITIAPRLAVALNLQALGPVEDDTEEEGEEEEEDPEDPEDPPPSDVSALEQGLHPRLWFTHPSAPGPYSPPSVNAGIAANPTLLAQWQQWVNTAAGWLSMTPGSITYRYAVSSELAAIYLVGTVPGITYPVNGTPADFGAKAKEILLYMTRTSNEARGETYDWIHGLLTTGERAEVIAKMKALRPPPAAVGTSVDLANSNNQTPHYNYIRYGLACAGDPEDVTGYGATAVASWTDDGAGLRLLRFLDAFGGVYPNGWTYSYHAPSGQTNGMLAMLFGYQTALGLDVDDVWSVDWTTYFRNYFPWLYGGYDANRQGYWLTGWKGDHNDGIGAESLRLTAVILRAIADAPTRNEAEWFRQTILGGSSFLNLRGENTSFGRNIYHFLGQLNAVTPSDFSYTTRQFGRGELIWRTGRTVDDMLCRLRVPSWNAMNTFHPRDAGNIELGYRGAVFAPGGDGTHNGVAASVSRGSLLLAVNNKVRLYGASDGANEPDGMVDGSQFTPPGKRSLLVRGSVYDCGGVTRAVDTVLDGRKVSSAVLHTTHAYARATLSLTDARRTLKAATRTVVLDRPDVETDGLLAMGVLDRVEMNVTTDGLRQQWWVCAEPEIDADVTIPNSPVRPLAVEGGTNHTTYQGLNGPIVVRNFGNDCDNTLYLLPLADTYEIVVVGGPSRNGRFQVPFGKVMTDTQVTVYAVSVSGTTVHLEVSSAIGMPSPTVGQTWWIRVHGSAISQSALVGTWLATYQGTVVVGSQTRRVFEFEIPTNLGTVAAVTGVKVTEDPSGDMRATTGAYSGSGAKGVPATLRQWVPAWRIEVVVPGASLVRIPTAIVVAPDAAHASPPVMRRLTATSLIAWQANDLVIVSANVETQHFSELDTFTGITSGSFVLPDTGTYRLHVTDLAAGRTVSVGTNLTIAETTPQSAQGTRSIRVTVTSAGTGAANTVTVS